MIRPDGPAELVAFRAAAALVALHVLVDAFVAPEPGVARSDNLLSAAVPLVLLALAAWAYPRLRPGARAAVALVLGPLALTGVGIAVVHAAAEGPSGDDWTGFLLLPVGVALCVVGLVLLWRSRRPHGRRYLRRALLLAGAVVAAYWVLAPIVLSLVVTHRPRVAVEAADLGRPYETVSVETSDGLALAAWYVPSENGAAVIAFPGRSGPVEHARMLVRRGYGVLLLDMRGQGESEGNPNALGWGSARDLEAAVSLLEALPDVEPGRIGGLGLSVGGELMLEAAAGDPRLRAVVSEGAGERSVRENTLRGPSGWVSLPTLATLTAATAVFSGTAPPPALQDLVGRIAPRPVFLIYARDGQGGEELNPHYYEAAGEPKTLWEIPDGGHTGGIDARPEEYEERVVGFFDAALLGEG
ncbi:MAG TPA: CocE/NonD family hydrolase [Gaiellaceae bacterium]|nr:CocE/NonD family hydrolase [Gaiellaceae bacterium]